MRIIINIDVPELAPAIDFYCAGLGLALSRTLDDDTAELTGVDAVVYLLANAAGSVATHSGAEARHYHRHWTPVHLDFVVDDLAAATKQALNAGARQESECIEWKGSKCITFSDPFGHGFCLIEFENGSYRDDPA